MKYTKFTTIGNVLVYSKTGKIAPLTYTVKGKTVYGANGRKIGVTGTKNISKTARIKAMKNISKTPMNQINPMGYAGWMVSTIKTQDVKNYESAIRSAINDGLMDGATGKELMDGYKNGDATYRSNAWSSLNEYYDSEYGFTYSEDVDDVDPNNEREQYVG